MDSKQFLTQLLTMSGIVGIITGAVCKAVLNKIKVSVEKIKNTQEDNERIKLGLQALLRNELYELYDKWYTAVGYVPISVKENFANMYDQYHNLGANGVMDRIRDEFMTAPTQPRSQGGGINDGETKDSKVN